MTDDQQQDKILARIRALLEKAKSVAGTPEADVFNAKAFELIAKYGIDEDEATKAASIKADKLMAVKFRFANNFVNQRGLLLGAIAGALHCSAIRLSREGDNVVQVWGLGRHIERVKMLHDLLAVQMIVGASKATHADVAFNRPDQLHELRESWMTGFACAIAEKLDSIEQAAARQHDRNNPHRDYELALQSDAERARNAMRKKYPNSSSGGRLKTGTGFGAGFQKGSSTDLG